MKGIKFINIEIITETDKEKIEIGNYIHRQLVGNRDYIDCNIVLNIDDPRTVILSISEECKEIPVIKLHKEEAFNEFKFNEFKFDEFEIE